MSLLRILQTSFLFSCSSSSAHLQYNQHHSPPVFLYISSHPVQPSSGSLAPYLPSLNTRPEEASTLPNLQTETLPHYLSTYLAKMQAIKNALHRDKHHDTTTATATDPTTSTHHHHHEPGMTGGVHEPGMTGGVHEHGMTGAVNEPGMTHAGHQQPVGHHAAGHHENHHLGRDAAMVGAAGYAAEKHHGHHHNNQAGMGAGTGMGMGMGHNRNVSDATASTAGRTSAEMSDPVMAMEGNRIAAESGNNFPGTNPHPAHSALGAMSGRGTVFPGRE